MAKAQRLKLRLFLEGIEVPVIAVQIQAIPNSPLACAIQIPPVAEGTRLLPRTLVHVFFLDFYEEESPFISTTGVSGPTEKQDPTTYERAILERSRNVGTDEEPSDGSDIARDQKNDRYKLLFTGEILGFQWTKNQSNRSLVLQCADLSNYWDYAYQWSNTGLFGPGIKALFSGGSTNLFTDFLSSKSEVITNILRTPSINFPKLKGLAGGIVHMLEAIGGTYHRDKKIAGQNIFFSTAELRLHITQMIAAYEDDPTASRLLANQGYGGLFNRILGGMGGQTSIRQVINGLSAIIFHETYAQPCPLYEPGLGGSIKGSVQVKIADDPKTRFIAFGAATIKRNLEEIKTSLRISEDNPELALPNFLGAQRTAITQRLKNAQKLLQSSMVLLRKVQVPNAKGLMGNAASRIGKAAELARTKWKPNDEKEVVKIEKLLNEAIDYLRRTENLTVSQTPKKQVQPARLNQQILRPDVWFSAPPRCNVLFPEHYDTLNYRRSFTEEPTRLLLKTNDEFFGEDALFDKYYFAPKTRSLNKSRADIQKLLQNDLLEHELFTGILPVFEKMGELNIFSASRGVTDSKLSKVGLAQRSANFIYFKYRFAARQMTVQGKFNPYIICGFPGLVIDKYVDVDILENHNELLKNVGRPTREINKLLGTNFLGNFTQVTHTLSHEQGRTEILASYPRQPEESVEFAGASGIEEMTVSKRFEKDATRSTDVASIVAPKIGSVGPNLGRIVRVTDVTDLYRGTGEGTKALSTKSLLIFGSNRTAKPRPASERLVTRIPVGTSVDVSTLDKRIREELGLGKKDTEENAGTRVRRGNRTIQVIQISAFRVEEEVPRYRQEVVDLPAEEYIRPGWYGDIWHPARIGKAYERLFKIGAITDPTTVGDPGSGASFGAGSEEADDAMIETDKATSKEDPRMDAITNYALTKNASIEQAVAFLVATYSHIKQNGYDVEEFIRAYTWRPIATMVDMFGTSDLVFSEDGQFVLNGIEGFHSRAFGSFNDLFGLVSPEIEEILGVKRGTVAAVRGDTRKVKRDAVKDLISALGFARALLG